MRKPLVFALASCLCVSALGQEISLTRVASGLTNPIDIQPARDGSGRLFIVEQNGFIRILRNGALEATPFLNIQTLTRGTGECGLLGLAFAPGFTDRSRFYVNYTNPSCTESIVARYRVSADPDVADGASGQVILRQPQPFQNHNGGGLAFGPDGFLYVGFGDGGSGGDPQNNGQTGSTLLGKILRIDTESGTGTPYAVPASNPFVGDARLRPEIWALGLRNPWRFSFDRSTGGLWIADVGQNRAEEINFQSAASNGGENYGWRTMEGLACFNPSQDCNRTGLTLPVHEYTRAQGDVSVTGGYVYRGTRWPSLRGTYVYGDYSSGRIWGLRQEGASVNNRLLLDSNINISAFGEDDAGEMYVASHSAGEIFRIDASEAPSFTSRSVTNAASFEVGMTPGSAAVLFAAGVRPEPGVTAATLIPLPLTLDGVSLTVDGRAAPLFAVANGNGLEQVNFQVPWETAASTARVVVTRNGRSSAAVEIAMAPLQPGIFAVNGTDAILVRASDNSLVTPERPLRRGESVYLYATGLGAVDANPGTGNAGPRSPLAHARGAVTVTIDDAPCEVQFAGLAPDFAGIYQVNIRVPDSVRAGARDVILSVHGVRGKPARTTIE